MPQVVECLNIIWGLESDFFSISSNCSVEVSGIHGINFSFFQYIHLPKCLVFIEVIGHFVLLFALVGFLTKSFKNR